MLHLSEEQFKDELLNKLSLNNQNWIDGDKDKTRKTADLVNHSLKIAIEIKDDTISKALPEPEEGNSVGATYNLSEINKRIYADIRDANKKFREYPKYETVLLLRSKLPIPQIVKNSIGGQHTFVKSNNRQDQDLSYIGRRDKIYRKEVGCFLILCGENEFFYIANSYSVRERIISQRELEQKFGFRFGTV